MTTTTVTIIQTAATAQPWWCSNAITFSIVYWGRTVVRAYRVATAR